MQAKLIEVVEIAPGIRHFVFEAPNVTRLVVDGSGSPTSYTRLTINPDRKKDLFTLTRVPLQ